MNGISNRLGQLADRPPKKPKSSFEVSPPITQLMCLSELAMHVTSSSVNEMSRLQGKLVLEKRSGRSSLQTI